VQIFDYLERAKSGSPRSDCSLADAVQLIADDKNVRAIDIGDAWWQDVDTPQMLKYAEKQLAERMQSATT
jgi:dTDP-glucose pyrophosphorylase